MAIFLILKLSLSAMDEGLFIEVNSGISWWASHTETLRRYGLMSYMRSKFACGEDFILYFFDIIYLIKNFTKLLHSLDLVLNSIIGYLWGYLHLNGLLVCMPFRFAFRSVGWICHPLSFIYLFRNTRPRTVHKALKLSSTFKKKEATKTVCLMAYALNPSFSSFPSPDTPSLFSVINFLFPSRTHTPFLPSFIG